MAATTFEQASNGDLSELADILAAGLMRALARKSSRNSADVGESSLHISGAKSGHPADVNRRISDG